MAENFYAVGTVTVSSGGTTVTGVGTSWLGKIRRGDLFTDPAQGLFARVTADAVSNTSLEINEWPGDAMSGDAYEILLTPDSVRSSERTRELLEQLSVVQANGRGLFYRFSDTTADADPGSGYLRLDTADPSLATEIYIDNLDANGGTVASVIDGWDDSSSLDKGTLWLRSIADPSAFRAYRLTGAVVDGTGYRKLPVEHVGGSGSFAADDEIMVAFAEKGDAGDGTVASVEAGAGIAVDNTDPTAPVVSATSLGGGQTSNLGLAFSVAASALTISLKQEDGVSAPASGAGAVRVGMRSATAGYGVVNERKVESELSLTIPSTATMGRTNGLAGHLYHYLIDNAGTLELAVSGAFFGNSGITSTTEITTGADSYNVMYSATARSGVPFMLVGRSVDTQATSGTWAAVPTKVDVGQVTPYEVRFSAYKPYGTQAIATGTYTKITFNTEEYDVGGFYDQTNHLFRPPAGAYRITAMVGFAAMVDQSLIILALYKNGARAKYLALDRASGTGNHYLLGTVDVEANGSDYFEIFAYQASGASQDIVGGPDGCWAQGVRLISGS